MPIKYRLLGALVAAILCLGLICATLVWQALGHAQQQQSRWLLQTQAYSWHQLQAEQVQQLDDIATQLGSGNGQATALDLQQKMQTLANMHAGLRIDLFDENAKMLATTAGDISPAPLLDPLSVFRWTQYLEHTQGLHQMSTRQYHWLKLTQIGRYVLVIGQDVAAVLPILGQRLHGNFSLLNMRSTPVAGANSAFLNQLQIPAREEQVLTLASDDSRLGTAAPLQIISQPLAGGNGNVIGNLVWSREASVSEQENQRFIQLAAAAICTTLTLIAGGIFLFVRHTLSPLMHSMDVLQSLAKNNTEAALDKDEEDAEDESGTVARAVMQLRAELLSLETLRQERVRLRRQQERLIRDQLRSLAASLDPGSREEILQALGPQDPSTVPASDDTSNVLADLASILGRMSGLVSTQQSQLLKLLREVQASVQSQAILASLQQELEIARQMQLSILPRNPPDQREVDIASTMIAAKEVGGDFYDYFAIDDDHLAVVIADVSGKGVPAAFFMAISRTLLKSNGLFLRTPGATIGALNDQLCTENDQMMFVTAFYAVLQLSSGLLTFVNAGHNPPILLSQGAARYFPKGQNMALAVLENQQYHEGTLQLSAGDSLLLYTDGVTEAANAHNALYGDARLLQLARSIGKQPQSGSQAQQVTEQIVHDVRRFEAGAAQADDITIVALTYRGTAQQQSST